MLARQLPGNDSNAKCQMVLQNFDAQAKDWQMGHTKVWHCQQKLNAEGREGSCLSKLLYLSNFVVSAICSKKKFEQNCLCI